MKNNHCMLEWFAVHLTTTETMSDNGFSPLSVNEIQCGLLERRLMQYQTTVFHSCLIQNTTTKNKPLLECMIYNEVD